MNGWRHDRLLSGGTKLQQARRVDVGKLLRRRNWVRAIPTMGMWLRPPSVDAARSGEENRGKHHGLWAVQVDIHQPLTRLAQQNSDVVCATEVIGNGRLAKPKP